MRGLIARIAAVIVVAGLATGSAHAEASCVRLAKLKLPHVAILSATRVKAAAPRAPGAPPTPAYCKVMAASHPTRDSDIRIEVVIPVGGAWNGRYLQVGNGGFAGKIPEQWLLANLSAGFAVAGTDDGHASQESTDASWALGHPEKLVDYGYRALKETTEVARAVIAAYAGAEPKHAYFMGCSDGGREALMEAQRFPDDFDGIVVGDPANRFTDLLVGAAMIVQAMDAPGGYIAPAKLAAIGAAVLKTCGDQDDVIEDPESCHFDPAGLTCDGVETDHCLTPNQVATLRAIYGGLVDPKTGARLGWGMSPGGEAEKGGWAEWLTGTSRDAHDSLANGFGSNFYRYVQFQDPNYPFPKLDLAVDGAATHARYAGILDSADPDLSAFRKHGGKLIQYHGWSDPAIPPMESVAYYKAVQARMGDVSDFYRLFMAPGMLHCGGGAGPSVPPRAMLEAITTWVEAGRPPEQIVAVKRKGDKPEDGVLRTRPLCPYPARAEWDGHGERDKAESWRCGTTAAKPS